MSTRTTRQGKRSATTFDVRLHVKTTNKTRVNSTVPFNCPTIIPTALTNLDLNNTAVLQIQSTIENEVLKSDEFQVKFPGFFYFNPIVGMKCWRYGCANSKNVLKKSESFNIRTEGDSVDDVEIEAFKQEWIKQVTEHGEKVDGENQHYIVDVGIVACRFEYETTTTTKTKTATTRTRPNMTNIIVSHDEMSTITSLTGPSA